MSPRLIMLLVNSPKYRLRLRAKQLHWNSLTETSFEMTLYRVLKGNKIMISVFNILKNMSKCQVKSMIYQLSLVLHICRWTISEYLRISIWSSCIYLEVNLNFDFEAEISSDISELISVSKSNFKFTSK